MSKMLSTYQRGKKVQDRTHPLILLSASATIGFVVQTFSYRLSRPLEAEFVFVDVPVPLPPCPFGVTLRVTGISQLLTEMDVARRCYDLSPRATWHFIILIDKCGPIPAKIEDRIVKETLKIDLEAARAEAAAARQANRDAREALRFLNVSRDRRAKRTGKRKISTTSKAQPACSKRRVVPAESDNVGAEKSFVAAAESDVGAVADPESDDSSCAGGDSEDSSVLENWRSASTAVQKRERAAAQEAVSKAETRVDNRGYVFLSTRVSPLGRVFATTAKTPQYQITCYQHKGCSFWMSSKQLKDPECAYKWLLDGASCNCATTHRNAWDLSNGRPSWAR